MKEQNLTLPNNLIERLDDYVRELQSKNEPFTPEIKVLHI